MFIGREAELKFLQDKYDEKKGQLIVLYGRRRVGKPSESFADKSHISFFLRTKHGQGTACKIFKTNSAGGYTRKEVYFRIYRLGKGFLCNSRSALRG